MKKVATLKQNYEFGKVLKKGQVYYGKYISTCIKKNNKLNRLGIAVSSKLCNAVTRNRIKRLVRENYYVYNKICKQGYDIVFILNKNCDIEKITFYLVEKDLKNAFLKLGLINKEEN